MKVNAESLKLLGKELPWVIKYIPKDAEEFQVKLMDLDILSFGPSENSTINELFENVYLIDKSGQVIGQVGVKKEMVTHSKLTWRPPFLYEFSQPESVWFAESVEEAIERIGADSWETRYVVYTHKYGCVRIYKLPKSTPSLRTWLDQKKAEASAELNKTLNG